MRYPTPRYDWLNSGLGGRACAGCAVVGEYHTVCRCEPGWVEEQERLATVREAAALGRAARVTKEVAEHRSAFVHVKPVSARAAAAREALEKRMEKRMSEKKFKAVLAKDVPAGTPYWNGWYKGAEHVWAAARSAAAAGFRGPAPYRVAADAAIVIVVVEDPQPAVEFILWCPTSKLPPTRRFKTEAQAQEVAEAMAKRDPGSEFIVCELRGSCVVPPAAPVWKGRA